ncbi:MAG: hypothetical protein IPL40_13485 [Proteobacteria bacterium]|nr:hypothetical protein [Pseudomonadota bacterium]
MVLALVFVGGVACWFVSGLPLALRAILLAAAFLAPLLSNRLRRAALATRRLRVEVDGVGLRRLRGDEVLEDVRWDELVAVSIVTSDEGPDADDFFLLLRGAEGGRCVIALDCACELDLLARLQQLPRFDNEALASSAGSARWREFVCWEGAPGEGLAASEAAPQAGSQAQQGSAQG